MHYLYLFIALFTFNLFVATSANAQINVIDADGERIILMPDGTWEYADQNKQAKISSDIKAKQEAGKVEVNKKKLTSAQKKQLKKYEKAQKRRESIRKKLAKQEEKKRKAEEKKRLAAEKKAAKLAGKKEKSKKNKNKKTSKKSSKNLTKTKKSKKDKINADLNVAKKGKKKPSKKQQTRLVKQQFKPFKIVKIVKPEQECSYDMNEVDQFTKKLKVATKPSFFFGYTHPELEKFLKGGHYLVVTGHMSEVSGLKALNLKFTFDSESAQQDYGSILEGSRLLISLLDGTTITLVSGEADGGRIDRNKKQTVYKSYFVIDSRSEKKLKKSEVNKVRMVWSQGFEDYDVTEVDFIINQLNCINNATQKKK